MFVTGEFMSPEMLSDKIYTNKCDIYSLGLILYWLCALKAPFEGETRIDRQNAKLTTPSKRIPSEYSDGLNQVI